MFKKKKAIRKANVTVEEPEEPMELPEYEDEIVDAVEEQPVQPIQPKPISKPKIMQVPVFLTQADLNKMTYDNHLMLMEILKLAKEE